MWCKKQLSQFPFMILVYYNLLPFSISQFLNSSKTKCPPSWLRMNSLLRAILYVKLPVLDTSIWECMWDILISVGDCWVTNFPQWSEKSKCLKSQKLKLLPLHLCTSACATLPCWLLSITLYAIIMQVFAREHYKEYFLMECVTGNHFPFPFSKIWRRVYFLLFNPLENICRVPLT